MTHVADEQLGKIARQQADLFRRVREGSLDTESVSRRLQEIIEGKPSGNTYSFSVDYGRSVDDGVKAGRYDWVHSDIISRNVPTVRKDTAEIAVELVHFNQCISIRDALRELDRMSFYPAELHELLAFGEKYPEVQFKFPIVTLGSVFRGGHRGDLCVPCLGGIGSWRGLGLDWVGTIWSEVCRFAAVRSPR